MGTTIWVLEAGQEEDNWDHSFIIENEKYLNKLADTFNVTRLTEFYDYSILNEEYSESNCEPNYIDIDHVKVTLETLLNEVRYSEVKLFSKQEIIDEIEDCLMKVNAAKVNNKKIRFALVP
jgi:hypothetical protein